jgi:hypothetical protein
MSSFFRDRASRSTHSSQCPLLETLADRIVPANLFAKTPSQAIDDTVSRAFLPDPTGQPQRLPSLPALTFSCAPLPLRRPELGSALAAFAEGKLPGAGAYVAGRLTVYDAVIFAANDERIAAFGLVQDFDIEGTRFVYLGPLFSRRGAYLRLFTWYVGRLAAEGPDRPLYLAAEVQNPEVLLTLYTLFPHSAFPRIEDGGVPPDARGAALALAERLDHLGALDPATLATRSDETLYVARPGHEPAMDWLRERSIDPARGDSQLVIVRAGASVWERTLFCQELSEGLESLRPGRGGHDRVIAAFRRAVRG